MYVVQRLDVLGGPERQLLTLIDACQAHEPIQVVSVVGGESSQCWARRLQGIRWTHYNLRWTWPLKAVWTLWLLVRLPRLMKRESVTIVHTHAPYANLIAGLAARLAGVRGVVATVHGASAVYGYRSFEGPPARWRTALYRWVDRLTAKIAHRVIVPCRATKEELIREAGVAPERVEVIYNGVRIEEGDGLPMEKRRALCRELGVGDACRIVGMVGNLFPVKGHRYFLEAAQRLSERWPDVVFWIVGGPGVFDPRPLSALAAPLVQRDRVRFLGARTDARDLLWLMEIVAIPSLTEGFPFVALEALGRRRPVVASAVGGLPEMIRHGETGLLVPSADSVVLARAIDELLRDPAHAERLGRNGQRFVREAFTEDRMVRATVELYQRLLH